MNELQSTISQDAKDLSAWLERIESFHPEAVSYTHLRAHET